MSSSPVWVSACMAASIQDAMCSCLPVMGDLSIPIAMNGLWGMRGNRSRSPGNQAGVAA